MLLTYKVTVGNSSYLCLKFSGMTLPQFKRNKIIQYGVPIKFRKQHRIENEEV